MSAAMGSMNRNVKEFTTLLEKPEVFLTTQPALNKKLRTATKVVYDLTKSHEDEGGRSGALPQLIVKDFNEEQIWQELELQNTQNVEHLVTSVAGVLVTTDISFRSPKKLSLLALTDDNDRSDEDNNDKENSEVEAFESDKEDSEEDEIQRIKSRLEGSAEEADDDSDEDLFASTGVLEEDELMQQSDDEEDDDDGDDGSIRDTGQDDHPKKLAYKSSVDDRFFKLCQMEEFLDAEDAKEEKKRKQEQDGVEDDDSDDDNEEEEDVDMFADFSNDDEEDGGKWKYEDFFDPPTDVKQKKKVQLKARGAESDGDGNSSVDDEDESETKTDILSKKKSKSSSESMSTFEKTQEKLKNRIKEFEQSSLSQKTWQLKGEVTGPARPENSLLEEHLQFDVTTRGAPVITEETTKSLEDLIKQRIKDKAWDDVERKIKPKDDVFEYKKRIVLDQEKSKQSLSAIYEEEYLKQQRQEKDETEVVNPQHENIRKSMRSLFVKLDALSNFHYTPKEAQPELRIVSNVPSIMMEEVAPVTVSDHKLLAPEEVQVKSKRDVKGQSERMSEDRRRDHREKKLRKRQHLREKEEREKLVTKMNPGLGNKYSKEKALKELEKLGKTDGSVKLVKGDAKKTGLASSTSFFSKLQDEVSSQIKHHKVGKVKKKKESSVKLKL